MGFSLLYHENSRAETKGAYIFVRFLDALMIQRKVEVYEYLVVLYLLQKNSITYGTFTIPLYWWFLIKVNALIPHIRRL